MEDSELFAIKGDYFVKKFLDDTISFTDGWCKPNKFDVSLFNLSLDKIKNRLDKLYNSFDLDKAEYDSFMEDLTDIESLAKSYQGY